MKLFKVLAMLLFWLALIWLLLEVLLRVGFGVLPYGTQGILQHTRRVPWNEEHLIPPFPYILSYEHQARVAPNHHDFPVQWGDAKFRFDTISLWEMPVGFRSNPPQWPVQIVALGDSFTFCWVDFEDCWVQRLHANEGWSVMDLGIPGTGTLSHQSLIVPYVLPLEPQVVVWQWYGNDYIDDYDFDRIQNTVVEMDAPPKPQPDPELGAFADYSVVYRLLRYFQYQANHPQRANGFTLTVNDRLMYFTDQFGPYDFEYPATLYGYNRAVEGLEQSQATFQTELNVPTLIVLIPAKEEVYAAFLEDHLDSTYQARLSEGRNRLWETCQAKQWHCLDLTDALIQAVEDGQTVYHAFDFHLDASGNAVMAREVAAYIEEQGWLTP